MSRVLVASALALIIAQVIHPYFTNLVHLWMDGVGLHGLAALLLAFSLLWLERSDSPRVLEKNSWRATGMTLVGAAMMQGDWVWSGAGLPVIMLGFICLVVGPEQAVRASYPLVLLLFLSPFDLILAPLVTPTLQTLTAAMAEALLQAVGVEVMRDLNVLTIPSGQLIVSSACSGINTFLALGIVGAVSAHLVHGRLFNKAVLFLSIFPLTQTTNSLRVAAIGLAAQHRGMEVALGTFHEVSGYLAFGLAYAAYALMGFLLHRPISS